MGLGLTALIRSCLERNMHHFMLVKGNYTLKLTTAIP